MQKIIDGKIYNTDAATEVCSYEYSNPQDFRHYIDTLYYTKKGPGLYVGKVAP